MIELLISLWLNLVNYILLYLRNSTGFSSAQPANLDREVIRLPTSRDPIFGWEVLSLMTKSKNHVASHQDQPIH